MSKNVLFINIYKLFVIVYICSRYVVIHSLLLSKLSIAFHWRCRIDVIAVSCMFTCLRVYVRDVCLFSLDSDPGQEPDPARSQRIVWSVRQGALSSGQQGWAQEDENDQGVAQPGMERDDHFVSATKRAAAGCRQL